MKKYSLILVCLISFAFISKAQTLQVSWDDENYNGYYTVKVYLQTAGGTPIFVGEKKNILGLSTTFTSTEMELPPVIMDQHDYYQYHVYVFRQSDPTYDGYGNSGWLDSDEFILTVTINSIIIDN